MVFRGEKKDPKLLIKIGMLAMIPAGLSRLFLHAGHGLSENTLDGVTGFLYGIAIGGMGLGIWLQGRHRRNRAE